MSKKLQDMVEKSFFATKAKKCNTKKHKDLRPILSAGLRFIACVSYGCFWLLPRYIFRYKKDYGCNMCLVLIKTNAYSKHKQ